MKLLMVSSEAYPFSKTGGLGDIAGSLPMAFDSIKIDSSLAIPLYKDNYKFVNKESLYTKFKISHDKDDIEVEIIKIKHPENSNITVYFIKQDKFFKRNGIYSENGIDYKDNASRFILFSKAVVRLIIHLYEKENFKLDIVHLNDWQTSLIALYIKEVYNEEASLKNLKVVFTIHNLAYQGNFATDIYNLLNVSWKFFVHSRLEFYGNVSFIKAGIILSDTVTTVSPSYAKEIQNEAEGFGLNNLLAENSDKLFGILNGVNDKSWNPKTDKYLKYRYSIKSDKDSSDKLFGILNGVNDKSWNPKTDKYLKYRYSIKSDKDSKEKFTEKCVEECIKNKKLTRVSLYKEFDFISKHFPLITMISRFDPQKGLDLIYSSFFELSTYDGNFIFLFSKNNYFKNFEEEFIKRANRTKNIKVVFDFDESLAHRLTAGSDMYLMPSKFEPCGLNQIYSMKYGSLPIVHSVGGLKDTVINYSGLKSINKATGFAFNNYSVKDFVDTMDYAFNLYNNKKVWNKLIYNAMNKDYSLLKTALEYKKLYKRL